jgi:hypothetical protein
VSSQLRFYRGNGFIHQVLYVRHELRRDDLQTTLAAWLVERFLEGPLGRWQMPRRVLLGLAASKRHYNNPSKLQQKPPELQNNRKNS